MVNVAKNIGDSSIKTDKNHPSIKQIEKNRKGKEDLVFKPVTGEFVNKQINK